MPPKRQVSMSLGEQREKAEKITAMNLDAKEAAMRFAEFDQDGDASLDFEARVAHGTGCLAWRRRAWVGDGCVARRAAGIPLAL